MPEHPNALDYEWIRWLSGRDATVLLMKLCQQIENVTVTSQELRDLVEGWRTNACGALGADTWKATVDAYLEVTVDARLYLLSQHRL